LGGKSLINDYYCSIINHWLVDLSTKISIENSSQVPTLRNHKLYFMSKGKVKFFNESKGFGFIIDDESGKEHFVHISGLVDAVQENDAVIFELQEGKKGLNAVNVKLAD